MQKRLVLEFVLDHIQNLNGVRRWQRWLCSKQGYRFEKKVDSKTKRICSGLVLNCYELRTRQHKMLKVKALRPSKHYFP
jgi:hypothetical protein